jgi:hypothetical protein
VIIDACVLCERLERGSGLQSSWITAHHIDCFWVIKSFPAILQLSLLLRLRVEPEDPARFDAVVRAVDRKGGEIAVRQRHSMEAPRVSEASSVPFATVNDEFSMSLNLPEAGEYSVEITIGDELRSLPIVVTKGT